MEMLFKQDSCINYSSTWFIKCISSESAFRGMLIGIPNRPRRLGHKMHPQKAGHQQDKDVLEVLPPHQKRLRSGP